MKFNEFLTQFLNQQKDLVEKKIRSKHCLVYTQWSNDIINRYNIDTIDINELIDIFNGIIEKLKISNNSKILFYSTCRVFLKFLASKTKQFFDEQKFIKPLRERNTRQSYSESEMKFLEKQLDLFNNPRFTLIWKLIKHNGVRLSEFVNIDWKELISNDFKLQIQTSKGGNYRLFKVPKYLQEEVVRTNLNMSSNTIQNFFTSFKNFVKKQNPNFNKRIHAHILRHYFITKAMLNLGDISKVQALTGHVNQNVISDTYISYDNLYQEVFWDEANAKPLEALERKELLDTISNLKKQNLYLKKLLEEHNIDCYGQHDETSDE